MSLSKSQQVQTSVRQDAESSKKLYQLIVETGRQVEVASSKCIQVQDLFSSELLTKRMKLKEMCEKLLCESPKNYGPLARERLWRYVFYEPMARARQLKRDKPWTPLQLAYIQNHLLNGIGQLNIFLMKIQDFPEFLEAPVRFRRNGVDSVISGGYIKPLKEAKETPAPSKWLLDLIHICLINIGDLYRYLTDVYSKAAPDEDTLNSYFNRAQDYYTQAFLVNPDSGLSHNQLGNLSSNLNGGVDAAYYLLYSMVSANSYDGAYPNFRQLLDRKIVQFVRQPASVEPKPLDVFVHSFLSLLFHFLCEDAHLKNFERSCQDALTNFNERLVSYDPDLDEKFLLHVSSISIMAVWRLQTLNSPNVSPAVAFAMSVFFQLVTQLGIILEQHCHLKKETSRPPSKLDIMSEGVSINPSPVTTTIELPKNDDENGKIIVKKKKKKKNSNLSRKRRRHPNHRKGSSLGFTDSEEEDVDIEEDDEIEAVVEIHTDNKDSEEDESDEDSELWSDSDDDSDESISGDSTENENLNENDRAFDTASSNGLSDTSGSGNSQKVTEVDQKIIQSGLEMENGLVSQDVNEQGKEKFVIYVEDLTKCWGQVESLLVAIAPFIRWLEASPLIKKAFSATCEKVFLEKLCVTLNLLASDDWSKVMDNVTIQKELNNDWSKLSSSAMEKDSLFQWELPEDRSMIGLPNFKEFVVGLLQSDSLSKTDMLVIRIGRMLKFGHWMTETESFAMIYTPEDNTFFVPPPDLLQRHLRQAKMRKLVNGVATPETVDMLTKAYQTMEINNKGRRFRNKDKDRNGMGTKRGRGRRRGHDRPRKPGTLPEPTLVIVDLQAMLQHMKTVKRVASHCKYIVHVPHSVYKTLDMLKETEEEGSKEARIASRWLERALFKSHPGVRAQHDNEKVPIDVPYPTTSTEDDMDAWEYFEMMECCNHILKFQLKNDSKPTERFYGDIRDKYRIFFLTGHDDLLDQTVKRDFSPIAIARGVGVFVDYVASYPALGKGKKWKMSSKSNG